MGVGVWCSCGERCGGEQGAWRWGWHGCSWQGVSRGCSQRGWLHVLLSPFRWMPSVPRRADERSEDFALRVQEVGGWRGGGMCRTAAVWDGHRGEQGAGRVAEGISGCVCVMGALVHIYCPLLSYFTAYLPPHIEPFCSCQGSSHRVQIFHPLFIMPQIKQSNCFSTLPICAGYFIAPDISYLLVSLFWQDDIATPGPSWFSATLKCIPEALEKSVPSPLALTVAPCTPDTLPSVEGLPGPCVWCAFMCDSSAFHSSWPWSWVWYPHGSPLPTGPST